MAIQQVLIALGVTAPPSGIVSFQDATGPNYIASGTSINLPLSPSGIVSGDALFAVIYGRSALTPPSGWTLVASQANPSAGVTQTIYLYSKDVVSSGDSLTSFTWSQASSGRMGLAYILARSTTSAISVRQSASIATDLPSTTAFDVPAQVLTATTNGELFIVCATSLAADAAPNNSSWSTLGVEIVRGASSQPENRLGIFTTARNSGQSNSANVRFGVVGAAANEFSTITARLGPA